MLVARYGHLKLCVVAVVFKLGVADKLEDVEMPLQFICDTSQTLFVCVWFFRVVELVDELGLKGLEVVQIPQTD